MIGSLAVSMALFVLGWTKEIVGIFLSEGDLVGDSQGMGFGIVADRPTGKYNDNYIGCPGDIPGGLCHQCW